MYAVCHRPRRIWRSACWSERSLWAKTWWKRLNAESRPKQPATAWAAWNSSWIQLAHPKATNVGKKYRRNMAKLSLHLGCLRISADWHAFTCRLPLGKFSDWKVDRCPSFRGKYIYMQLFVWAVESLNQTLKAIARGFRTWRWSSCADTRLQGFTKQFSCKWTIHEIVRRENFDLSSRMCTFLPGFCCRWIPPVNQGLGIIGQRSQHHLVAQNALS